MPLETLFQFINLAFIIVPIIIGLVVGSLVERRHYRSIRRRETDTMAQPAVPLGLSALSGVTIERAHLVTGSTVVAMDAFKAVLAGLRFLFGGRVGGYESLIDRARREATLRMKVAAGDADAILNVRLETFAIGGRFGGSGALTSVEAVAYGTAVWVGSGPKR